MKKLFLILAIFSIYQTQGYAQDNSQEQNNSENKPKNYRQEERRRQIPEPNFAKINPTNLSPEKQELLKKEQQLHAQNIKNISGVELMFGDEEKRLSPEEGKARGEKIRSAMENLPESKKAELKQEMQRHRQQMKNITGVDISPANENLNKNQPRNCQGPSPEEMQKHRQAMESLPANKKEMVKKEMERHRLEMKNITGLDLPRPSCENELK